MGLRPASNIQSEHNDHHVEQGSSVPLPEPLKRVFSQLDNSDLRSESPEWTSALSFETRPPWRVNEASNVDLSFSQPVNNAANPGLRNLLPTTGISDVSSGFLYEVFGQSNSSLSSGSYITPLSSSGSPFSAISYEPSASLGPDHAADLRSRVAKFTNSYPVLGLSTPRQVQIPRQTTSYSCADCPISYQDKKKLE